MIQPKPKEKKINVSTKSTELLSILSDGFDERINLARIKLICHFICALCKVQTVTFDKLARAFDTTSKEGSSLRRIQRFISSYKLCPNLIARFIFRLLPNADNYKLTIDRTNWKFGNTDINIFMLGVVYNGVAFPLLFTMLNKRGNSNSQERIDLVNRFIYLFGKENIDCIVADREFVGEKWIQYLNEQNIKYYIRIRNNFKVFIPPKNKTMKVSWLFQSTEFKHYSKIVKINNQLCYLSGCRLKGNGEKQDYLIIVSFTKPQNALHEYKKRWQIEMCFKAMKSSGFDIEKTHLNDSKRIEKLLLLVMIAFVWCYKVGIYLNQIIPIKIKTHNRKAVSIFKYGLNYINKGFLNIEFVADFNIFKFLSCT
jgi:hypothetical protein